MTQGQEVITQPGGGNGMVMVFEQAMSTEQAIKRKKELSELMTSLLNKDVDYGIIPGVAKPSLLQPGADKLNHFYGLTTRVKTVKEVENWEAGFFAYDYLAQIIWPRRMPDGSIREEVVAEVIGHANSKEVKYAWRWAKEADLTPELKAMAAAGSLKKEARDEWKPVFTLTAEEKIRCAKEKWQSENRPSKKDPKQQYQWIKVPQGAALYRIPNDAIFDQVNTLKKMAQKRAYVGATIRAVKASDLFTQDVEDMASLNITEREAAKAKDAEEEGHEAPEAAQQTGKAAETTTAKAEGAAPKKDAATAQPAASDDKGKDGLTEKDRNIYQGYLNDLAKATTLTMVAEIFSALQKLTTNQDLLTKGWKDRLAKVNQIKASKGDA